MPRRGARAAAVPPVTASGWHVCDGDMVVPLSHDVCNVGSALGKGVESMEGDARWWWWYRLGDDMATTLLPRPTPLSASGRVCAVRVSTTVGPCVVSECSAAVSVGRRCDMAQRLDGMACDAMAREALRTRVGHMTTR